MVVKETTLSECLGIEPRSLFLHSAKGTAHGNGGKTPLRILRFIDIGREFKAEMVVEGDLLMLHLLTLWKHLVPLLCHLQLCHFICVLCPGGHDDH